MRKIVVPILMLLFFVTGLNAQNIVKGIVLDSDSESPLKNVSVSIKDENNQAIKTNDNGVFSFYETFCKKQIAPEFFRVISVVGCLLGY